MRKILIATYLFVVSVNTAHADESKLIGVWVGNDRASEAIYEKITITKEHISWGGDNNPNNAYCITTYNIVSRDTSETYPGNDSPPRKGVTFAVFKLKLAQKSCTKQHGYFQFALPSYGHPPDGYAEVIPYTKDDRPMGWHNFSKSDHK